MKYKIGDTVYLYSWQELVNKYTLSKNKNSIITNREWKWNKQLNDMMPKNRIITIDHFDIDGDCYFIYNRKSLYVLKEVIKSHINEYYLQQIKEEINNEV